MSIADQFKKLFSPKAAEPPQSEQESRLSLATPDASVDPLQHDTVGQTLASAAKTDYEPMANTQSARLEATPTEDDRPDLIKLPVVGRKSVVEHQRNLTIWLILALLALAVLTAYALIQANRTAKQLGATGQALMQSQRLAKSTSLALVGNQPAFADVFGQEA